MTQQYKDIGLFFFGSLVSEEMMKIVLGHSINKLIYREAILNGYSLQKVKDENYPALFKNQDAKVNGVLVKGFNQKDMRRIQFFEGEDYNLNKMTVEVSGNAEHALVCCATNNISTSEEKWVFEEWSKSTKYLDVEVAKIHMSYYDKLSSRQIENIWEDIRKVAFKKFGLGK